MRYHLPLLMLSALLPACAGDAGVSEPTDAAHSGAPGDDGPLGGKADTTIGPVTSMRCSADAAYIRKGGFVEVDVQAKDAAGQLSRNYALTVTPSADARVVQRNKVVFNAEGAYEIACCALDTGRCDHTAVQVGQLYPALAVSAPKWADEGGTVLLEGRALDHLGEPAWVEVGGRSVRTGADGRFTASVPARSGINTFEIVAGDGEGRTSTRYAWTLAGPFGDLDRPEDDGVVVALGTSAYPQLSSLVRRGLKPALNSEAFYAAVMKHKEGESGLYDWKLDPVGIGISDVRVRFSPSASGLSVDLSLDRVTYVAEVQTKLGFFGWKRREVDATLDRLDISASATIRNGRISLSALSVELVELDVEISDLPGFVEDILLYFFEDDLAERLGDELREQLDEKLEGALEGFARDLPVALPAPLHGELTVSTSLSALHGDADGLVVGLGLTVDGETDPLRAEAPGPWRGSAAKARPFRQGMYEAAASIDVLNTLFFAGWQTGALDMSFTQTQADIRANPDVPGVQRVDYFVDLALPPIIQPGDAPGAYFLDLGAMQLDAIMETDLGFINASAAVGGRLSMTLKAEGDQIALVMSPESVTLDLQVAPVALEREGVRRYFARLIEDQVFPKIAELSKAFPIPEADLSGLGLEGIHTMSVEGLEISGGIRPDVIRVTGRMKVR